MADAPPADLTDHLALALVPGLGPKLTANALAHFGSAAAARRGTVADWEAVPQVGRKLAAKFAAALPGVDVDAELRMVREFGVRLVLLGAPEYPAALATIPDPPALLYVRGDLRADDARAVGMVGSRHCTAYGLRTAERMAAGLAMAGWVVISGLARGIDGACHRGALSGGGRTLAVLAGGLSSIYPPEHAHLADQIAESGALITETPMTVDPQPGMFPARNRIVSGLSRAVVVVEANVRSGALITVDHAAEQGRDVYAVPGPVDSPASAGCLDLIRKGARLVRTADDVIEDVQGLSPIAPEPARRPRPTPAPVPPPPTLFAPPAGPPPGLSEAQAKVWEALESPKQGDELAREVGIPAGELAAVLMALEMKKAVRRLAGNRYERR